jgi:hypothetical protein
MDACDKSGSPGARQKYARYCDNLFDSTITPLLSVSVGLLLNIFLGLKFIVSHRRYALDLNVCLFFITSVDPPATRSNCTVSYTARYYEKLSELQLVFAFICTFIFAAVQEHLFNHCTVFIKTLIKFELNYT